MSEIWQLNQEYYNTTVPSNLDSFFLLVKYLRKSQI